MQKNENVLFNKNLTIVAMFDVKNKFNIGDKHEPMSALTAHRKRIFVPRNSLLIFYVIFT